MSETSIPATCCCKGTRTVCCGCTTDDITHLCCLDHGTVPSTLNISFITDCGGPYSGTLTISECHDSKACWSGFVVLQCQETDFSQTPPKVVCRNETVNFTLFCGDCIAAGTFVLVMHCGNDLSLAKEMLCTVTYQSCNPFLLIAITHRPIDNACLSCGWDFDGIDITITE